MIPGNRYLVQSPSCAKRASLLNLASVVYRWREGPRSIASKVFSLLLRLMRRRNGEPNVTTKLV